MTGLFRTLFVLLLLATPLAVVAALPRLVDMAGSAETSDAEAPRFIQAPALRLARPTLTTAREPSVLDDSPPPTLVPSARTATPAPTPLARPTGERITIGNTGGQGAVLRAEPVTGSPVAALRDSQMLDVLERRSVTGGGEWLHVRTDDGKDGWVTGVVALPAQ